MPLSDSIYLFIHFFVHVLPFNITNEGHAAYFKTETILFQQKIQNLNNILL